MLFNLSEGEMRHHVFFILLSSFFLIHSCIKHNLVSKFLVHLIASLSDILNIFLQLVNVLFIRTFLSLHSFHLLDSFPTKGVVHQIFLLGHVHAHPIEDTHSGISLLVRICATSIRCLCTASIDNVREGLGDSDIFCLSLLGFV